MLKCETRNYLESKQKSETQVRLVSPLEEKQQGLEDLMQRRISNMKPEDLNFFEREDGFFKCLKFFVKTLVKDKEKILGADEFNIYLDWSNQDF